MAIRLAGTILIILLMGLAPLLGQVTGNNATLNLQDMRTFGEVLNISQRENGNRFGLDFRSQGVDGSPFLYERTYRAKLVMQTGDTLAQPVDVNLDLENYEVFVRLEDGEGGIIPAKTLRRVVFDDPDMEAVFVSMPASFVHQDKSKEIRLYQILHEGDYQLLKYLRRKLVKSNKNTSYSTTGSLNDKYMEEESYYFCQTDERCERIRLRGKDVIKTLEAWGQSAKALDRSDEQAKTEAELVALLKKLEVSN